MNNRETGQVLATIQAYTNRTVDAATIRAWHALLHPYRVEDALQAVREHYRDSKEWLMPSDIIGRVRMIRAERLARFPQHLRLSARDEAAAVEAGTYRERMAELLGLAADGVLDPETHAVYVEQDLALDTVARRLLEVTQ